MSGPDRNPFAASASISSVVSWIASMTPLSSRSASRRGAVCNAAGLLRLRSRVVRPPPERSGEDTRNPKNLRSGHAASNAHNPRMDAPKISVCAGVPAT